MRISLKHPTGTLQSLEIRPPSGIEDEPISHLTSKPWVPLHLLPGSGNFATINMMKLKDGEADRPPFIWEVFGIKIPKSKQKTQAPSFFYIDHSSSSSSSATSSSSSSSSSSNLATAAAGTPHKRKDQEENNLHSALVNTAPKHAKRESIAPRMFGQVLGAPPSGSSTFKSQKRGSDRRHSQAAQAPSSPGDKGPARNG
mmetsp:Transcript_35265/g.69578  ORF Transcript_35265/g.69578 Transcript_35265/m.69578 type:complete len:199 (+) Transcript_35265:353-949(+)